LIFHKAFKLHT